jgi:hypothetical protein
MLPQTKKVLDQIVSRLQTLTPTIDGQYDYLVNYVDAQGTPLRATSIPGQIFGAIDIYAELKRVLAALRAMHFSNGSLVPNGAASSIDQILIQLESSAGLVATAISQMRGDTAPPPPPTAPDGAPISAAVADPARGLDAPVTQIADLLDQLENQLVSVTALSRFTRRSDPYEKQIAGLDLSDSAAALALAKQHSADSLKSCDEARAAAQQIKDVGVDLGQTVVNTKQQLDQTLAAIEQAKSRLEQVRVETETILGTAQQGRDQIGTFLSNVTTTEATVSAVAGRLGQADQRLKELEGRFEADQNLVAARITEVQRLTDDAESMLKGATVAGLAKAFDDERRDIDRRMGRAFVGFISGIGLLLIMSSVIVAYVLGIQSIGPLKLSGTGSTVVGMVTLPGILSRALILLAPFWLTLFSARRYAQLFALRQQYSHKYNLAFSVEGFKKQAPKYGEEIAAIVFQAISTNPFRSPSAIQSMGESPLQSFPDLAGSIQERIAQMLPKMNNG